MVARFFPLDHEYRLQKQLPPLKAIGHIPQASLFVRYIHEKPTHTGIAFAQGIAVSKTSPESVYRQNRNKLLYRFGHAIELSSTGILTADNGFNWLPASFAPKKQSNHLPLLETQNIGTKLEFSIEGHSFG